MLIIIEIGAGLLCPPRYPVCAEVKRRMNAWKNMWRKIVIPIATNRWRRPDHVLPPFIAPFPWCRITTPTWTPACYSVSSLFCTSDTRIIIHIRDTHLGLPLLSSISCHWGVWLTTTYTHSSILYTNYITDPRVLSSYPVMNLSSNVPFTRDLKCWIYSRGKTRAKVALHNKVNVFNRFFISINIYLTYAS